MKAPSVVHSTFVIERSFPQAPAQVFAAFADPALKRRWFAYSEHHAVESFELDFQVGGAERMRSRFGERSPFPGAVLASDGIYLDIAPDQRIVIASDMRMGEHRFSVSLVTFELLAEADGTTLVCTFQGAFFERADGPEMREAGWRKLIDRLAEVLAGQPG